MAHQPDIKAHSLTGRITDGLMQEAFQAVKRNRGAAGIDKVSIQMFAANLEQNLHALMRDLKDGSFEPLPLRRHYIPKNETEFRPLGIPAVRDRVAQEVGRRLLQPIFEPTFHDASYGFRPGRNCHQAIQAVLKLHEAGLQQVVDADITGFFDNLPFKVIMAAVAEKVADGNILRLIEKFLRSGVMENGAFKPTTVGTPQGGVLTPRTQWITFAFLGSGHGGHRNGMMNDNRLFAHCDLFDQNTEDLLPLSAAQFFHRLIQAAQERLYRIAQLDPAILFHSSHIQTLQFFLNRSDFLF